MSDTSPSKPVQSQGEPIDAEKLRIGQIVTHLKVGQAWTLIGILIGMMSGAFFAGYKASSYLSSAELTTKQSELVGLKTKLADDALALEKASRDLERYRRKDRFLSLFLNYQLNGKQDSSVRSVLDTYVMKLVDESEKDTSFVQVIKGQARDTTVVFWDGAKWTVPQELVSASAP